MNIGRTRWAVGGAGTSKNTQTHTHTHSVHRDLQGGRAPGNDPIQS